MSRTVQNGPIQSQMSDTLSVIATKFSAMADAIVGESDIDIKQVVRVEVEKALFSTNKFIEELKEMVTKIAQRN